MYKLFIDTETVGLNHEINPLIQVAGIICNDEDIKEEFNFTCKPFDKDILDESTLLFHAQRGISKEDILAYQCPRKVYQELINIFSKYIDKYIKSEKMVFLGYNVDFDYKFLRHWFTKFGDKYFGSWFWNPPIDIAMLAMEFIGSKRSKLENFKQSTVARYLGIEVNEDKLHDALYDIHLCRQIYEKVCFKRI